jgi:hypothetical protein
LILLVNKAQKTTENRPTFSHKTKLILGGVSSLLNFVMNGFEPECDDVVWMRDTGKSPVNNLTFLACQLTQAFTSSIESALRDSPNSTAKAWFADGVECELVDVSTGGGWKKGKIRLRLEFVPDEPEPEPANNDTDSLDSLRTELCPKP